MIQQEIYQTYAAEPNHQHNGEYPLTIEQYANTQQNAQQNSVNDNVQNAQPQFQPAKRKCSKKYRISSHVSSFLAAARSVEVSLVFMYCVFYWFGCFYSHSDVLRATLYL